MEPLTKQQLDRLLRGFGTLPTPEQLAMKWPVEEIVHPGLTVITGQPEVGKSFLVLSLCRALLDGDSWLAHETHLPSDRRILLGCEDHDGVNRATKLFPTAVAQNRLYPVILGLGDEQTLQPADLQDGKVGLVIIDSVFNMVADVNNQETAGVFVSRLRGAEVPVVVVHHEARGPAKGPSGAQTYRAAYRHTVHVSKAKVESSGPAMSVEISGNNVQGRRKLNISIDTATLEPSALPGLERVNSSVRQGRQKRIPEHEKVRRLAEYASAKGIDITGEPNKVSTKLFGGSRNNEDPVLKVEVAVAMGVRTSSHQTVATILQRNLRPRPLAA